MSSRLFTINLLFLIFTKILYKTIKSKINLFRSLFVFFTTQLSVSYVFFFFVFLFGMYDEVLIGNWIDFILFLIIYNACNP